jgi:DNA-binding HxlR family transcriptional regulator
MATKRTYGDACGIARALDVVGERWALLVVRELVLGPKRFTDLRNGLPHIGPDVLAQRLRELEQAGVVRRSTLPPPAASHVYELTERGQAIEPVLLELGRWGSREAFPPGDRVLGADSAMLALKTMFDPVAADGLDATFELRLGADRFRATVSGSKLDVTRGTAEDADAAIETDPGTLADVLWDGRPLTDLAIEGSRPAVRRFVALFAP